MHHYHFFVHKGYTVIVLLYTTSYCSSYPDIHNKQLTGVL